MSYPGAMENAFGDETLAPAEAGSASPLKAEYPEGSQGLLDSLKSEILSPPFQEIDLGRLAVYAPTGWEIRLVCPFCSLAFGTCSHPQAVNPITEASAP